MAPLIALPPPFRPTFASRRAPLHPQSHEPHPRKRRLSVDVADADGHEGDAAHGSDPQLAGVRRDQVLEVAEGEFADGEDLAGTGVPGLFERVAEQLVVAQLLGAAEERAPAAGGGGLQEIAVGRGAGAPVVRPQAKVVCQLPSVRGRA